MYVICWQIIQTIYIREELDSESEERLLSSVYYRVGNQKDEGDDNEETSEEDDSGTDSDDSSMEEDANTEYKGSDSMDEEDENEDEKETLTHLIDIKVRFGPDRFGQQRKEKEV